MPRSKRIAPLVFGRGSTATLEATGMPLGLFPGAAYEALSSSSPTV